MNCSVCRRGFHPEISERAWREIEEAVVRALEALIAMPPEEMERLRAQGMLRAPVETAGKWGGERVNQSDHGVTWTEQQQRETREQLVVLPFEPCPTDRDAPGYVGPVGCAVPSRADLRATQKGASA